MPSAAKPISQPICDALKTCTTPSHCKSPTSWGQKLLPPVQTELCCYPLRGCQLSSCQQKSSNTQTARDICVLLSPGKAWGIWSVTLALKSSGFGDTEKWVRKEEVIE